MNRSLRSACARRRGDRGVVLVAVLSIRPRRQACPASAAAASAASSRGRGAPSADNAAADAELAARKRALARAHAAVVGLEATAVEEAGSAATLGRERQGSGVVIGADGLVLTIGYLILEADRIDLALSGGRSVPARVVAYDLATGFGLVQALTPLAIEPAPLGDSTAFAGNEPLLIASGGADGGLSLAQMVSRRAFSGYWEYHIENALFTAPARPDHSGAGALQCRRRAARHRLADRRRRARQGPGRAARQHVRADRPAEADPRRTARARRVAQQPRAPGSASTASSTRARSGSSG